MFVPHTTPRQNGAHRIIRSGPESGDVMDIPLLAIKLHIPPARPDLVPRPRLLQRLDAGLQPGHRLTLVAALVTAVVVLVRRDLFLSPSAFAKAALIVRGWD